jgi:hypothetical protein
MFKKTIVAFILTPLVSVAIGGGEEKLIIHTKSGDVPVTNFYQNPQIEIFDKDKDAIIKNDPNYQIMYYGKYQSFFISLLGGNLHAARKISEREFLKILNITKNQACKLPVSVSVPHFVNHNASGTDYGLSFCPDGKPLP